MGRRGGMGATGRAAKAGQSLGGDSRCGRDSVRRPRAHVKDGAGAEASPCRCCGCRSGHLRAAHRVCDGARHSNANAGGVPRLTMARSACVVFQPLEPRRERPHARVDS
eukprot:Amastigsp_a176390_40.p7 type:complete len:109 gc:universal Amastigsp_a176390_40:113-439(+)